VAVVESYATIERFAVETKVKPHTLEGTTAEHHTLGTQRKVPCCATIAQKKSKDHVCTCIHRVRIGGRSVWRAGVIKGSK